MKIFVLAMYKSKYGRILYCTKVNGDPACFEVDLNNIYIQTFYFKGKEEIEIDHIYDVQTIKGENGMTYCFLT